MAQKESLANIAARGVASLALKATDNVLRGNTFTGFGKFTVGGLAFQFDYEKIRTRRERKLTILSIDGAKGEDIQDRGAKGAVVQFDCWFSGPLKFLYRDLLNNMFESGKAQTMLTDDVVFDVVIVTLEFTRNEEDLLGWNMMVREHRTFPAFLTKTTPVAEILQGSATALSTIEDLL